SLRDPAIHIQIFICVIEDASHEMPGAIVDHETIGRAREGGGPLQLGAGSGVKAVQSLRVHGEPPGSIPMSHNILEPSLRVGGIAFEPTPHGEGKVAAV